MLLDDLEKKLKDINFPEIYQLDECTKILNTKEFIESHIQILKSNPGNTSYKPYYDRLLKFYKQLNI